MTRKKLTLLFLLILLNISFVGNANENNNVGITSHIKIDENNKSIQITTDKNKVGGHNDIIIGNKAGSGYDNKGDNVMIGLFAGKESKGRDNVYLGNEAGKKVVGSQNIEIGHFNHKGTEELDKIVSIGYYSKVKYNTGASIGFFSISDREALTITKKEVSNNPSLEKEQVYALKSASTADKEAIKNSLKIYKNKQFKINGLAAFSVGNKIDTRQIIHVSPGTEDTDAVNLAQLKAVGNKVDSISEELKIPIFYNNGKVSGDELSGDEIKELGKEGKLGIYFGEGIKAKNIGKGLLISLDGNLGGASKKYIDDEVKKLTAGIAGSYAIANIPQVSSDKRFSIGAGVGYYGKKSAFALGLSGQDKDRKFIYKISASVDTKRGFGVGAGFNYSFGKTLRDEELDKVMKENKELKERLDKVERILETLTK